MTTIRLLSEQLINRIAAGEVVERPSAVLKELIENSLDAGATYIEIEAQAGGRRLVSVADNGCGMTPDDLLLSIERHATSKLSEETDLLNMDTLGFRGEALPSIGAVSRMTITSASGRDGHGRRVRVAGGRLLGVDEAARDQGTSIEVQDLFFNVPARRKFLKSAATEAAHLLETAQRFALGRSELRLIYRHNGKELLSTSPREDDRSRLARILGRETARAMFPFEGQAGAIRLEGFLGRPEMDRSRTSGLYLFINGRPVRDRLLSKAVLTAYKGRLASGRYPVAVVFLTIDPERVDVNVHPTKAEVRFRRPAEAFDAAVEVMTRALSDNLRPAAVPRFSARSQPAFGPGPSIREATLWTEAYVQAEDGPIFSSRTDNRPQSNFIPETDRIVEEDSPVELSLAEAQSLRPIGQLFRSYILAQGPMGLYVVDQHAAHERVLFEKMKADLKKGTLPGQALLIPETLELTPLQARYARELAAELARYGFELSPFGGRTFVLKAVPATLAGKDAVRTLEEIVDAAEGFKPDEGLTGFEDTFLQSLACHAAVKAGDEMAPAEMDRLLADLAATEVATNCPHGRPLIFHISRREIEKKFRRV